MTSLLRSASARLPRRLLHGVPVVVLGLLGGWLGLTLGGTVHHEVGPLATSMRVLPSWGGDTTVRVPPLGELVLDTHSGPLGIRAQLEGVDIEEARQIVRDPELLRGMDRQAEDDLRWELQMALLRGGLAAVLGAGLLAALGTRRVRGALAGGATAAVALATCGAVAVATWNPGALSEPRYTGLLSSAPSVVGQADQIVNDFSVYGDQMAKIVHNVTGLYAVASDLPILPPREDVVRVLHVSDLHLAPQAWDVVGTLVRQYDIDVVVDSGDITDHGSRPENRYLQEIRRLPVPYVWVRGNHDSLETQRGMAKIDNVVVLDGKVRVVKGLRFLGVGDPTFTPDKSLIQPGPEAVERAAERMAETARAEGGVDVAVFHDSTATEPFDGLASMVLSGHLHYRKVRQGEQGTWMMQQGSTGGSGLRALEPKEPSDIEASVLYVERASSDLLAYDDIRIGGLGLSSAEINRQVVDVPTPLTEMVAPAPEGGTNAGEPDDEPEDEPGDEPAGGEPAE
ncbi:MAG TPA: metallophosphoesterase [Nocardioidaceae bacterium]|nr:metallophosphoesterase [Nocardioidaceae bacterium]HSE70510.1 metallophosphoesterase [Nocardioidaceae bacterium]